MPAPTQQSIRTRIVRKIVLLVVGHLLLILVATGVLGGIRLKSRVLDLLQNQSESELTLIEQRIASLVERTENFAASSAVTKSLIDDGALRGYLPAAVEELSREREVVAVTVANYSGTTIARSSTHQSIPEELDVRAALSSGLRSILSSKGSIFILAPVMYYGTPQGAVIVEIDLRDTLMTVASASQIDHVEFYLDEVVIFHYGETGEELLTMVREASPSLPLLHKLKASVSLGRQRSRVMAPVISSLKESAIVGLIAIFASIILARRIGSQLAAPIRELAKKVRDGAENCAPTNTNDELETLALAFDEQTQEILGAKASLERRVAERTKSLEENAEKLKRSNEELDDFAHIASHDLKEPLRGIHNYSSFLLEDYKDKLDGDGVAKLETLQSLTQRMEGLINDLLYYSQVGRVELAMGNVDMNDVVREVCESLAISIRDANIEVRIPRPLPVVYCDRIRIGEVVRNFVTNAIKYNNKDERWIEIGWDDHQAVESASPRHIALYVKDNGIGIRPKHKEAVFKMFRRLHGREKFGGGHGVGLSIVKKVIERLDGTISLESEYGVGSTFWFTVPKITG